MSTTRETFRLAVLVVTVLSGACHPAATPPAPAPLAFADVTTDAGIQLRKDSWGTFGAAWGDYDGDGHVDFFVSRHGFAPALFRNLGRGRFEDVTNASGLRAGLLQENLYLLDRHGCAWGDADADGRLDLYCSTGAKGGKGGVANQLFRNDGDGRFTESAADFGVVDSPGRGRNVHWIDYDRDGRLDLFVANTRRPDHPSRLFRGAAGRFLDVTAEAGLAGEGLEFLGGGAAWCDLDGDRDPDLLLAAFEGLRIHRNRGSGTFTTEDSAAAGIPAVPVRAATCDDFDGDGVEDLYLAVVEGASLLLRNRGDGTFEDVTERTGAGVRRAMAAVPGDFDNDGRIDLFVVRGYDPESKRNLPDALFVRRGERYVDVAGDAGVTGPASGGGDSAAVADFDADGFLDLLVTNGGSQPDTPDGALYAPNKSTWMNVATYPGAPHGAVTLLRNLGNANHWLEVRLVGKQRKGVVYGAKVTIRAGGSRQVRTWRHGVSNYGQGDSTLHFGLGGSATVDELTVDWPDGRRVSIGPLQADRVIDVLEESTR